MNAAEVVDLIRVYKRVWPRVELDEGAPEAWLLVLGDVPAAAAADALVVIARRGEKWPPSPGEIRVVAAIRLGLLDAPAIHLAFEKAARVASAQGLGRGSMHPAVRAAYDAIGGAGAWSAPSGVVSRQFERAYEAEVKAQFERVLDGDLTAQTVPALHYGVPRVGALGYTEADFDSDARSYDDRSGL